MIRGPTWSSSGEAPLWLPDSGLTGRGGGAGGPFQEFPCICHFSRAPAENTVVMRYLAYEAGKGKDSMYDKRNPVRKIFKHK